MINTRQKTTFTLIELLVVIAIIAILASMLLPALKNARGMAYQATGTSKLKQIAIGVGMYVNDNRDWLPLNSGLDLTPGAWRFEISSYLAIYDSYGLWDPRLQEGVFLCPTSLYEKPAVLWYPYLGGYGWNARYMGYTEVDGWGLGRERKRITNVPNPSETALCGDTSEKSTPPQHNYAILLPPTALTNVYNPMNVGNRHSGGINVVWVDSHITLAEHTVMLTGKNGDMDYYYKKDK